MRTTLPNTTFSKTTNQQVTTSNNVELDKLVIKLENNSGFNVLAAILFTETGSTAFNELEDIKVMHGRSMNLYTQTTSTDLIIDKQDAFTVDKVIPLGFLNSDITNNGMVTLSLADRSGIFNDQTIYLYDALLNVVHNLSSSSYIFTSSEIVTEGRFYLQFTNTSSNLAKQSNEEVVVYSKDGIVYATSKHYNITELKVVDLYNVKNGIKSVASAKQIYTKSVQVEVTDLSKLIEVTITLENGTIVHKKISK